MTYVNQETQVKTIKDQDETCVKSTGNIDMNNNKHDFCCQVAPTNMLVPFLQQVSGVEKFMSQLETQFTHALDKVFSHQKDNNRKMNNLVTKHIDCVLICNNDGIFVAPRDGIYMFSRTVSTVNAAYILTELVVEKVISSTWEREVDSSYHSSASITAFCRMNKDEHAWIITTGWNTENYIHRKDPHSRTSFPGLLIH
ncbi:unnamed protein product [Mytilus coruscus]|uniref:C1q domain-containing protein n=1 Tax=Mytilus coruscus TaxID=42192 RepID=A0A6J8A9U3_MYTCO|nr:unnamed protein product [Mytilus coruscus]